MALLQLPFMAILDYLSDNIIEFLGFLFGVIYVILAIKENFWCWIAGIVNVVMYIIVFYERSLYGMMGLQVVYLFMSIYGLLLWSGVYHPEKSKNKKPQIIHITTSWIWILSFSVITATFLTGFLLTYTDNEIPWTDGLITSIGLAATWMTARKYIENWLVWIGNDMLCIFIYLYLGLYLTMAFYIILFIMAIVGYIEWKKKMTTEKV